MSPDYFEQICFVCFCHLMLPQHRLPSSYSSKHRGGRREFELHGERRRRRRSREAGGSWPAHRRPTPTPKYMNSRFEHDGNRADQEGARLNLEMQLPPCFGSKVLQKTANRQTNLLQIRRYLARSKELLRSAIECHPRPDGTMDL